MTEAEIVSDVVFQQPQIISEVETMFPTTRAGAAGSSPRPSGAPDLGRRLLLAARAGETALVLDLMAKGAPFTNDWLGTSPLHLAASNAHTETCGVLLRAGVSRESRTKVERTPLHLAAYAGHADVVELLLEHGAQVDCRDMLRMTPLHWAAERGHAAAAAALLRRGADPRALSKFRKTPAQLAAARAHAAVLRLIDDELKLRENDKSVRALMLERPAEETPAPEPQQSVGVFTTIQSHRNIQEVKIKPKPVQDKTTKPEQKTEKLEAGSAAAEGAGGGGGGEGAAAALLRRHGITLLPADDTGTVLSALQSGRTVVLSDAGKLMLKESEEPPPARARGVLLTATPVRAPPAGVKVFTVNNRMSVTPTEVRPRAKIMTPQDLQQVKIVQLPPEARLVSPRRRRVRVSRGAARAPVKIIMNKANFERLVAGAAPPAPPAPAPAAPVVIPASSPALVTQSAEGAEGEDAEALRSRLAAALATIGALTDELRVARARLAQYERPAAPAE